jgi:copper chaperone CopZ
VRVAIQKLPGVESVQVSLERASTDIQLRAGNSITLQQLRAIIRNNGFPTKSAVVTVDGQLVDQGGQPALTVTGTNAVLLIELDPKQPAAFKDIQARLRAKLPSNPVRIEGVVEPRADLPDRVAVRVVSEDRR